MQHNKVTKKIVTNSMIRISPLVRNG